MGIYLNPSSYKFEEDSRDEYYVDKTGLIEEINKMVRTPRKYVCVSRPRRFGKTMAAYMLGAYYSRTTDAKVLFDGFKIAKSTAFLKYASKFDVLQINMQNFMVGKKTVDEMLMELKIALLKELRREYKDVLEDVEYNLWDALNEIFAICNRQFVIIIDEWDCIFRVWKNDVEAQRTYLDFIRAWLKDQQYVALAYMTGILPIKKYGEHSALNMFHQYSMNDQDILAEFTGFTTEDVKELCKKYHMDYENCKAWYDGYSLSYKIWEDNREIIKSYEIYTPLSVVCAMGQRKYKNFWNQTETYEALKIYIALNIDGLKDKIIDLFNGGTQKVDIRSFSNDMITINTADDVFSLLVHLGYLAYDYNTEEVRIPNREVEEEFSTSIKNMEGWEPIAEAIKASDELIRAAHDGDAEKVAQMVEKAHLETSHLQYNDENALSYTIALAFYSARRTYNMFRELPTGKGFADMVFVPLSCYPGQIPMLIELKWNRSANTAIKQIKNKEYAGILKDYSGEVLLIGINYSKKTRKHTCAIERLKFE